MTDAARAEAPVDHEAFDALVERDTIVICCGSGGVGKTTTAAVIAQEAARRGRNAVVVTIDPAKRLANALGLDALSDTPSEVPRALWDPKGEAAPKDGRRRTAPRTTRVRCAFASSSTAKWKCPRSPDPAAAFAKAAALAGAHLPAISAALRCDR